MKAQLLIASVLLAVLLCLSVPGLKSNLYAGQQSSTIQSGEADSGQASKPARANTPELLLPETEYNFGNVAQNSKLTHTFIVKNVGDEPLRLINAKGS